MFTKVIFLLLLLSVTSVVKIVVSSGDCDAQHSLAARVRSKAPSFKAKAVINDAFVDVNFEDYQAEGKWVVLLFYPFDYTFVCPTELISYSDAAPIFEELNTKVLAISTDSHHTHLAWTRAKREDGGVGHLDIPLVADTAGHIAKKFGIYVSDPDDDMFGAALRGLFIIDPTGKIRNMQVNDDTVGRNVKETLRLLKGFQYSDSHVGEACPASWEPGDDSILANYEGSKSYFKSHYK